MIIWGLKVLDLGGGGRAILQTEHSPSQATRKKVSVLTEGAFYGASAGLGIDHRHARRAPRHVRWGGGVRGSRRCGEGSSTFASDPKRTSP